ncbi:hypothetical protein DSECCO2_640710 [anaerobic digester metagenome]
MLSVPGKSDETELSERVSSPSLKKATGKLICNTSSFNTKICSPLIVAEYPCLLNSEDKFLKKSFLDELSDIFNESEYADLGK